MTVSRRYTALFFGTFLILKNATIENRQIVESIAMADLHESANFLDSKVV
jgi:hypothetical protein